MNEPVDRARYDFTWLAYPWEFRVAYWLRCSEAGEMVCTRCGIGLNLLNLPGNYQRFVDRHRQCPLGYGLRGGTAAGDPLLAGDVGLVSEP